jgi:hypothetical protein
LFLIAERSFVVGDLLDVNGRVDQVLSIDLLSVTLRTFDNLMMRVPNEEMIKTTAMKLAPAQLERMAAEAGFEAEPLEKVLHLFRSDDPASSQRSRGR